MREKWPGKKQSPRISWTLLFFTAGKNQSRRNSWTLFFFRTFLPHVWDLSFQNQGSGYSLRGAKGILYWSCPIQILSKCWGWSNGPPQMDTSRPDLDGYSDIWNPCDYTQYPHTLYTTPYIQLTTNY